MRPFLLSCLLIIMGSIYFFVTAPPQLPEYDEKERVSYTQALSIWAHENDVVRQLWTSEIVGKGKEVGLKFDENWRSDGIHAGPLPALFLRSVARELEKSSQPISLFLGSDYPISRANLLSGIQLKYFQKMKLNPKPHFFFSSDTQRFTAIFADRASAQACVDCHNNHLDSPKVDWKRNDIMGATTWAYPKEQLSGTELLQGTRALRQAIEHTYQQYLDKVKQFPNKPQIGGNWPKSGYFLPSREVFMEEFHRLASAKTLSLILEGS